MTIFAFVKSLLAKVSMKWWIITLLAVANFTAYMLTRDYFSGHSSLAKDSESETHVEKVDHTIQGGNQIIQWGFNLLRLISTTNQ